METIKALCIKSVVMNITLVEEFTKGEIYYGPKCSNLVNNSGRNHSISKSFFKEYFVLLNKKSTFNYKCVKSIKDNHISKGKTYGIEIIDNIISCINDKKILINLHIKSLNHFKGV